MKNCTERIVYVAGPLSGDVSANVARAEVVAHQLANAGVTYFCPHLNAGTSLTPGVPEIYWIEADLVILRRCHAIQLVTGWERSRGTRGEMMAANRIGIPTFYPGELNQCIEFAKMREF